MGVRIPVSGYDMLKLEKADKNGPDTSNLKPETFINYLNIVQKF